MASQVHEFEVEMSSQECVDAIKKALEGLEGVNKVDIELEKKIVLIDSTLSSDELLEALKKTGKNSSYVGVKAA
ncbi:copper transport protein ATOX1-like [Tachypleus tridentatus]|uniref:copper transport protein ATOX1-like n=1 Tax=Tachypleus tridentatus TaxID=6853 RepID=UPI003FD23FD6